MVRNAVLGSPAFFVAVTGLLAQLPPTPYPPRRRAPSIVTNLAAGGGNGGNRYGGFDASAWKDIAFSIPEAAAAAPPMSSKLASSNESIAVLQQPRDDTQERERGAEAIDVDVEKLPTFVFFGRGSDGQHWREDVVGGGNARVCAAKLQEKMNAFSSRGGTLNPDDSPSLLRSGREGKGGGGVADIVDGRALRSTCLGKNVAEAVVRSGKSSSSDGAYVDVSTSGANVSNCNVVEVSSKDHLLHILRTQQKGQGPVVVMYHAPWCRKCTYLTPLFRRLADARMPVTDGTPAAAGGDAFCGGSIPASSEPTFYRADVSNPSWERRSPAAAFVEEKDEEEGAETEMSHSGSPDLESCDVCGRSGFVPCGECEGKGAVARSSPDGKHTLAVTCPACVGYKRQRCPSCGGKCYMCD